jgi:hypothetical protein
LLASANVDVGEFAVADVLSQLFGSDPEKIGPLLEGVQFHIIPPNPANSPPLDGKVARFHR